MESMKLRSRKNRPKKKEREIELEMREEEGDRGGGKRRRILGNLENWNGEERGEIERGVGDLKAGERVCSIASNANGMVQEGLNVFEDSKRE